MEFQFINSEQVVLEDDLPDFITIDDQRFFTPVLFTFLITAKLLDNLHSEASEQILWSALEDIGSKIKKDNPYGFDDSLIGVFSDKPLRVVKAQLPREYVCHADLFLKDEKAFVEIKAPKTREHHFYKACLDLSFENARRRVNENWGKGALVCTGLWLFVWHLSRSHGSNMDRNYDVALASAIQIMKDLE